MVHLKDYFLSNFLKVSKQMQKNQVRQANILR